MSVAIALFTRDLRVHDNPVLHAACHAATEVVPLFVLDTAILASGSVSPNRAVFLTEALADVDTHLRSRGGHLVVRSGAVVEEVERIVADLGASEVHLAADVSGYSDRREQALRQRLAGHGCPLRVHANTVTVVEPGTITPAGGRAHFAVFTPYRRRWEALPVREVLPPPRDVPVPHDLKAGRLPSLATLGCDGPTARDIPTPTERQ